MSICILKIMRAWPGFSNLIAEDAKRALAARVAKLRQYRPHDSRH